MRAAQRLPTAPSATTPVVTATVCNGRLLDHKPTARHVHYKRGVVEVVPAAAVDCCVTRLVDATVQPDDVAASAKR
jgi:hypothetical protein